MSHPNRPRPNGRPDPRRNPTHEEIRAARESLGLTVAQAADIALHSLNGWINWENGTSRMHPAIWAYFTSQLTLLQLKRDEALATTDRKG